VNILVTGATGFVGGAVARELTAQGNMKVLAAVRQKCGNLPDSIEQYVVGGLASDTDYGDVFGDVDVVIHAAARVHVMADKVQDPLAEFRNVNVDGTLHLARQAVQAGVKRFVFISSIKVNGEATHGQPFRPDDVVHPEGPYGLSKWEAEQGLFTLAAETGMDVVVIRPPLIYGPGVKANFLRMFQWVQRDIPLPLGAIHNQRSLVALENLVDFIVLCATHPRAANEVFLISDDEDVSTSDLLRKVAKALDKPAHLIPVSVGLMRLAAKLIGKENVAKRLFGSLQVDSSKACELLGWKPVISMDEQLKKTVGAM